MTKTKTTYGADSTLAFDAAQTFKVGKKKKKFLHIAGAGNKTGWIIASNVTGGEGLYDELYYGNIVKDSEEDIEELSE